MSDPLIIYLHSIYIHTFNIENAKKIHIIIVWGVRSYPHPCGIPWVFKANCG